MSPSEDTPLLLRLPLEIRLLIYHHLLIQPTTTLQTPTNLVSLPTYHEYEKPSTARPDSHPTLSIRNYNAVLYPTASASGRFARRTSYKIRAGRFRNECLDTTYVSTTTHAIDTGILKTCRQTHDEAARVLYAGHAFDFDTSVEAVAPFFADLTPVARRAVRRVGLTKRALPYDKDFDRAEWANMCAYLAGALDLRSLRLGVVSGKPVAAVPDAIEYRADEFALLLRTCAEQLGWVEELAQIRGLRSVDVRACVEHCPPPQSEMMKFFVAFSASVEAGFSQYLSGRMIEVAA